MTIKCLALCIGLLAACPICARADEESPIRRSKIKAELIVKFIGYTQWPDSNERRRLNLCLWGDTEVRLYLSQMPQPKLTVAHGIINVSVINSTSDLAKCDVLYLEERHRIYSGVILNALRNLPVLTITDAKDLSDFGWMLEIIDDGEALAFQVNLQAGRQQGLMMSARMLKLAQNAPNMRKKE